MALGGAAVVFGAALVGTETAPASQSEAPDAETVAAAHDRGRLLARPGETLTTALPVGAIARTEGGGSYYVPETAGGGPMPLLVLLHGTGGGSEQLVEYFRPAADAWGFAILAPRSRGQNWALIDNFFDDYERSGRRGGGYPAARFGRDVERVDAELAELFDAVAIDPERVWLFGYSHGGSYALALGSANPDLFAGVAAVAPGLMLLGEADGAGQRYFLAHGRRDRVQRFALSEDMFVPALEARGYAVRFMPFDGGHELTGDVATAALRFLAEGDDGAEAEAGDETDSREAADA